MYGRVNSAASIDRAGVRPLFLCTQKRIMNAIAAHKDELEKLLENLSGDTVVSEITFVALVNAYITGLDANCPDISARVNPPPGINRRINMDQTLTQNCALYYAQHKTQKRRASFFQRFRGAAHKQGPDTHRLLTLDERSRRPTRYRDNGR